MDCGSIITEMVDKKPIFMYDDIYSIITDLPPGVWLLAMLFWCRVRYIFDLVNSQWRIKKDLVSNILH